MLFICFLVEIAWRRWEALRLDMARGSQPEMAMLTEDLAEVRRQMKRRDEEPGAQDIDTTLK